MATKYGINTIGVAVALFAVLVLAGADEQKTPAANASKPAVIAAEHRPPRVPIVAVGSVITWNVPYVTGGGEQQTLDIYAPPGVKDAPVVVYAHRGEWAKGDKSEVCYKPKFLNENGVVFISVNYRLSGVAQHPAQVNDVAAAVRWVRDNIAKHGGGPHKIILMGHSAGCHIVSFVGLDPRPLATVDMKPGDLAGVVAWSGGAYDLPAKYTAGGMYHDYIAKNFGTDEAAQRDASPIAHIGDAKPMPYFMFASAGEGNPGSRELSEKMAELIKTAGGRADAVELKGKTHFTADYECGLPDDPGNTGQVLLDFISRATTAHEQ
ncbi:MAG: alpha/beta hydrolase [Phycisphaerae bacterium]|nr:alpha/beta hydrolase [Phycisphaerae bacterium]